MRGASRSTFSSVKNPLPPERFIPRSPPSLTSSCPQRDSRPVASQVLGRQLACQGGRENDGRRAIELCARDDGVNQDRRFVEFSHRDVTADFEAMRNASRRRNVPQTTRLAGGLFAAAPRPETLPCRGLPEQGCGGDSSGTFIAIRRAGERRRTFSKPASTTAIDTAAGHPATTRVGPTASPPRSARCRGLPGDPRSVRADRVVRRRGPRRLHGPAAIVRADLGDPWCQAASDRRHRDAGCVLPAALALVASVIRARRRRTQVAPRSLGNLRPRATSGHR